jgi:adenosine deaminase
MVLAAATLAAADPGSQAEARVAAHFETLRDKPPQLVAFLRAMPKGGDLHSHLTGAVYAERMIDWAAEDGRCLDATARGVACRPGTRSPTRSSTGA